jgi:hypothetical protein
MENFRVCPVEFDYPFVYQYIIKIHIPENFKVKYPENKSLQIFGNNVQFVYTIKQKEDELIVNITYSIKKVRFPAYAYSAFANFMYRIKNKLNEEIIIQKE